MPDFRFEEYNSKKRKYEFGLISGTFIFFVYYNLFFGDTIGCC